MNSNKLALMMLGGFLILSGCVKEEPAEVRTDQTMMNHDEMEDGMSHGEMEGHMSHDEVMQLKDSTGENELIVPPVLERNIDGDVTYTVRAQKGETQIFNGSKTKTYGYNGTFLGPMLQFTKGETIKIRTINELDQETTFHWHGLEVAADADGGPHDALQPGEERVIEFKVTQEAATLWFHPHPHGNTADQVYNGLAGLIFIEDENSKHLNVPDDYGKNDFPLIIQDKLFDENHQLNYREARNEDGTIGDTLLINGTVNPKLTVEKEKVRLRIVNGSNARNYTLKLNSGDSFVQIGTDGGFLNEPVTVQEVTLTPSERAEIVIDFQAIDATSDLALVNEDGSVLLPFDISHSNGVASELSTQLNDFTLTAEEKNLPVNKTVELFGMMDHVTINGKKFDPDRIDFTQEQGVTEVWEIYNKPDIMGGMIHPFHIHGAQFKIISRDGAAPPENEQGWKDSIAVHPDETVKIAIQFKNKGLYMFHCHILEHEDNGMMGQVLVE
ncbi:multicopper oxidase domain-containing protein [Sporosarcina saromensis]|uniref:Multicopper oxidase domain-containing protein n=1 Tax=Sporosarcina saromensis TaxID=359365 RepID=A0ABU4G614_9BACL|nr:multicopper oxidase domain-containing protein [Sporosarcina saromensis]